MASGTKGKSDDDEAEEVFDNEDEDAQMDFANFRAWLENRTAHVVATPPAVEPKPVKEKPELEETPAPSSVASVSPVTPSPPASLGSG